jgi:hypothetical protein
METTEATPPLSTEQYWAQVQALRNDLERLRPPDLRQGTYRETSARSARR